MKVFQYLMFYSFFAILNTSLKAQIVNSISINSDDPKGVLHVKQGIETGGCVECKQLGIVLEDSDADDRWHIFNSNTSGSILFWLFGANDNILTASASLNSSGVWTNSDLHLKRNIDYWNNISLLDKISLLKPATYQFKNHNSHKSSFGFIAQDVEQVFPEFVRYDESGYRLMNYSYMSALAIKGVQELYSENLQLRNDLNEIKAINEKLNIRLERIEKLLFD